MRWLPALSMMLVSVISYIDRNTLAMLAPTIMKDIGLNNEQYGYIIAAFSVAYCIGNPAWGRILDRFGVHKGMAASVSLWTLASVSHVFAARHGRLCDGACRVRIRRRRYLSRSAAHGDRNVARNGAVERNGAGL